jgi:hypothetical protein
MPHQHVPKSKIDLVQVLLSGNGNQPSATACLLRVLCSHFKQSFSHYNIWSSAVWLSDPSYRGQVDEATEGPSRARSGG